LSIQQKLNFSNEVIRRSSDDFRLCLHCLSCAGGCPVTHAMTYRPNGIIRLVQLGLKKEVLESSDIWLCMGCNTCSIACPMGIDIAAFMDALREISIEEKVDIAEPDILNFHQEVLHSIHRYGRTHKLEIMLRYKLRRWDFFSDVNVGLKMLAKRKLDLRPSTISEPHPLNELFTKSKRLKDEPVTTD